MVSAGGGDSWKYFCPAVEGTAIVCLPASDFDVVVVRTSFSQTALKASMSHLMSHHKTLLTKITGFSQRIWLQILGRIARIAQNVSSHSQISVSCTLILGKNCSRNRGPFSHADRSVSQIFLRGKFVGPRPRFREESDHHQTV